MSPRAKDRVTCDGCGRKFKARGMGGHRRRCDGARKGGQGRRGKKSRKRDTTAVEVELVQEVAGAAPIAPPSHVNLRDGDEAFWVVIVHARARETWTDVDLVIAANLARTLADIERVQIDLTHEGDVVTNSKGTQIVNPLHQLLETLTRRSTHLSKALHVHASATQGRSRDTGAKTKAEQKAKEKADVAEDDELLASPTRLH